MPQFGKQNQPISEDTGGRLGSARGEENMTRERRCQQEREDARAGPQEEERNRDSPRGLWGHKEDHSPCDGEIRMLGSVEVMGSCGKAGQSWVFTSSH